MNDTLSNPTPDHRPNTIGSPLSARPYTVLLVRAEEPLPAAETIKTNLRDFECTRSLTDGSAANERLMTYVAKTAAYTIEASRTMDMSVNALTTRQRLVGGVAMHPEGSNVLVVANPDFINKALQEIFHDPNHPDVKVPIPHVLGLTSVTVVYAVEVFRGRAQERRFRYSLKLEELSDATATSI